MQSWYVKVEQELNNSRLRNRKNNLPQLVLLVTDKQTLVVFTGFDVQKTCTDCNPSIDSTNKNERMGRLETKRTLRLCGTVFFH